MAAEHRPDLCLIDINMPGGGISAVSRILAVAPAAVVVMLTVSRNNEDLFDALQAGATGYLLKKMRRSRRCLSCCSARSTVRRSSPGDSRPGLWRNSANAGPGNESLRPTQRLARERHPGISGRSLDESHAARRQPGWRRPQTDRPNESPSPSIGRALPWRF